jgi:SAM-dependent methyltransferase
MNHFLHGVAKATAEAFRLPAPILEIGSYQVGGQESIANLRGLFPGKPYCGVDMRPGPGVDCVARVESLPQADESIGTVIAMSTFEHVPRFWRGFEEIQRVLRSDGVFLLSCPFYFHIHSFPSDYWRFTPEALDLLLEDYPTRIIGWHGPKTRPANVWAVAFANPRLRVTEDQLNYYKGLLSRYAWEPMGRLKQMRCWLARWICGRGPVAPYLDQSNWEITCRMRLPSPRKRRPRITQVRIRKPR